MSVHDRRGGYEDQPPAVGRFRDFFEAPLADEQPRRLLRQITLTQSQDQDVARYRTTSADRMTPWLRTTLANLLGVSRATLLLLLDAAGCVVVLLLVAAVWRWLT